jgi:hypothetical protein
VRSMKSHCLVTIAVGCSLVAAAALHAASRSPAGPKLPRLPLVWTASDSRWKDNGLAGTIVRDGVVVLVPEEGGAVWGLDLRSHRTLWKVDVEGHSAPYPIGRRDLLLVPFDHGSTLMRLDARTGKPRWEHESPGYLCDGGYFVITNDAICLAYLKPGSTDEFDRGTAVLDPSTGRAGSLAHPLPSSPISVSFGPLSVLLVETPSEKKQRVQNEAAVRRWNDERESRLRAGSTECTCGQVAYPKLTYSLAGHSPRTGAELWRLPMGTIQIGQRQPGISWETSWGPLLLWTFSCSEDRPEPAPPPKLQLPFIYDLGVPRLGKVPPPPPAPRYRHVEWEELWWIDAAEGRVLRRDRISGFGSERVLLAMPKASRPASASELLPNMRLLTIRGTKISLVDPAKPAKPLWARDLKPVLPPPPNREANLGAGQVDWPFATLCYGGGGFGVGAVLDLRSGTLYALAEGSPLFPLGLDTARREVYVLSGARLSAYRLPR